MTTYSQAISSWAEHLRAGGTTPWSAWTSDTEQPGAAEPGNPSATHLEVARRINRIAGRPQVALVDLVLAVAPTGRGLVDPPLAWGEPSRFGSPPVHPDALSSEELLRVALPVLVRLLPLVVPAEKYATRASRFSSPWRRSVRVHGSPYAAAALIEQLREQGAPTSSRCTHVVLARPLDVMMAEHWHMSSLRGSPARWWRVWRQAVATGSLPRGARPDRLASRLLDSGRPVHVVVADDHDRLAELVSGVVGRPVSLPPTPDPAETDLVRRLNRLLTLRTGPDRARTLAQVLAQQVVPGARVSLTAPSAPLAVPPWARALAAERSREMADGIRGGGYAVHGDPDDLVPTDRPGASSTVDRDRTLELALAAGVRAWQLQGGTP